MVAVPADTPVTLPVLLTVATNGSLLLHTPPIVASANTVVVPAQMLVVPVIGDTTGSAPTVKTDVAVAGPQVFVAV